MDRESSKELHDLLNDLEEKMHERQTRRTGEKLSPNNKIAPFLDREASGGSSKRDDWVDLGKDEEGRQLWQTPRGIYAESGTSGQDDYRFTKVEED